MGTYRLRVPASRVGYVPEAQGGLPPGPHVQYVLGTRTSLGRWVRTAYCGTPGLLLLDVEGAEEKVLWGAAALTRRWRPVLATEPRLEALSPRLFREHLVPLGYRFSGSCEGLSFYTANVMGDRR